MQTSLYQGASVVPPLSLDDFSFVGGGLQRPECVLCTKAGDVYTSDKRGGINHIAPDGTQRLYEARGADLSGPLFPNGFALERDGNFLVTHLDTSEGGVFRLRRDGNLAPVLREADGVPFSTTNFVLLDHADRLWITISTRRVPRDLSYRANAEDGFIVLHDRKGARILADGLGFANEVRIDPSGRWLYVNETYSRRLSRFRMAPDGTLGVRETVVEFGHGTFPDGLAFDTSGAVWVTSVISNKLFRVLPDGRCTQLVEDFDPARLEAVEAAYRAGRMGRPEVDNIVAKKLRSLSSIAFGGPDLRTAYFGVLLGDSLPVIDNLPVAGVPMAHWEF